ncbi:MAG: hypothetical protein ABI596_17255 [Pyrinomonadaceae bacterium]
MKQFQGKTRILVLVAAGILFPASLACNSSPKVVSDQTMFEGIVMKQAAAAFQEKLGGRVKALSLEVEKDSATLRAQDPNNLENVYEYRYAKGLILGPSPVKLNVLERKLDGALFDLDEINLAAAESLAHRAVEQTRLDRGRVTRMVMERGLEVASDVSKTGGVRWVVTVEGQGETASAYADLKGNIVGLDMSRTARAAQFNLFSADTLHEAGTRIKEACGVNVKLYDLVIHEKYLWFKALDPKNHREVNQYKYDINGVTIDTRHANILPRLRQPPNSKLKLGDLLFDLNEVRLESAPNLGRKALERLSFGGGQVSFFKVSRGPRSLERAPLVITWAIFCKDGPRSGTIIYDLSGRELEARRLPGF